GGAPGRVTPVAASPAARRRAAAALLVPLGAGAVHARQFGGAGLPVTDEHIPPPVGVPGHEGGDARGEGHEATVGADHGPAAAQRLGGAGSPVVDVDAGVNLPSHDAAVGANRGVTDGPAAEAEELDVAGGPVADVDAVPIDWPGPEVHGG